MIKDILNNYGLYIYIGLGLIVVIIITIMIIKKIKNKDIEEDTSSILDVNIDGVIDSDFKYGYENEDTIVVKANDLKKSKKKKK